MAVKAGLKREAVKKKPMAMKPAKDKGSFGNRGQKPAATGRSRMEARQEIVNQKLRKISRGMFHTQKGNPMHAQENA